MDAYGNLTDLSEFANGRRLRLISYMDPDIAFGLHAARPSGGSGFMGEVETLALEYFIGVRRMSLGDDGATVLVAEAAPGGTFTLGWGADPGCLLIWGDGGFSLSNDRVPMDDMSGDPSTRFTIDFVDGCWFALNNPDHDRVADIAGEHTDERTPIIPWSWNGGSNQIWRAEAV
jgi:hypothetical protein